MKSAMLAHLVSSCVLFLAAAQGSDKPAWPGSCRSDRLADDTIRDSDMTGKVVVLTGGDGNIAGEVSLSLAKKGALMILGCRKTEKCNPVVDRIKEEANPKETPEIEQIDLSSKDNINDFAKRVLVKHPKIDVLINSAGVYFTSMTHDSIVSAMEVNVIGPALLTHLLLPGLRGHDGRLPGRVVNVAAVSYGAGYNYSVAELSALATHADPTFKDYYGLSKYLMVHHALELAKREPNVAAFALAPGVAILTPAQGKLLPSWLRHAVTHGLMKVPDWVQRIFPEGLEHFVKACSINEGGLAACPQAFNEAASVICAAASWANIESYSGSYLDFETSALPADAPNVYGPWTQKEPGCTPREPAHMDGNVQAGWYDEMLRLMGVAAQKAQIIV